ncbi:MAG: HAMP domain-containing histidine kinase [Ruminococcus sp.]|nr:HAMP domain-containing histidine kinase [Ruminococcus sp.]
MKNSESQLRIIDMSKENKSEKKRKGFSITNSMIAKVVAFLLAIILFLTLAVCVVSAMLMAKTELYSTPKAVLLRANFTSMAKAECEKLIPSFLGLSGGYNSREEAQRYAENYCEGSSIVFARFTDSKTEEVVWEYVPQNNVEYTDATEISFVWYGYDYASYDTETGEMIDDTYTEINVDLIISTEYGIQDGFYTVQRLFDFLYAMLYWIYVVGAISLVLFIACVVFLLCSAGHRAGCDEVKAGWGTRVPFDVLTVLTAGFSVSFIYLFFVVANELLYYGEFASVFAGILVTVAVMAIIASVCLGWLMSFALRIKLGKWWRNTVIFYVLRALWRFAKFIVKVMRGIPVIWRTFLSVAGVTVLELIIILCCWHEPDNYLSFWIIEKLVLVPIVLKCAFAMKKLHKGAKALSQGEVSYQVNTEKMRGDFKNHGEYLNNIAEGMTVAVEERMKSERMKTELITNVSHDIKTPLTSIINYTDLISREPCENAKITEYAKVLTRSSERLKRLIEDLVEASKASTGNLDVLLAPCDADILLTQVAGEYGDRLKEAKLELIVSQPSEKVMIMADGRRLWRVFDNIFSNVCKYAQEFTRVYLSLERVGEEAVITLKNTSKMALNISEEELMERFVRGDKSRSTEGNGLGLSIARSLTQLQNGDLQVSIDGDLFKVTVRFPVME